MPLPNITVITVCRNAVTTIGQTIRSVMAQDYPHLRYIIIDGASTDGTQQIIEGYKATFDTPHSPLPNSHSTTLPPQGGSRGSFTYLSEPDAGIYDAMNKGLRLAASLPDDHSPLPTPHFVNFMNAGDTFASDDTISKVFSQPGIDYSKVKMIGGGTWNIFADSSKTFLDPAKPSTVIPQEIPFSHQACFTRLELCRFDISYRIAADYKLMYDIFFQYGADSIVSLDLPVANYQKDDSFSTLNPRQAKGEYLRIQSARRSWHWWKEYIKWRLL